MYFLFMNKILYIILISFIVSNCSIKPVIEHHGVPFLEEKQTKLILNKTNKNDIKKILGSPLTKSKFDNDIWIYIERKQTQSNLRSLGKMKILKNDVLVLEINDYGILKEKNFYNKNDMEDIKIVQNITGDRFRKTSFIYDFLSSMRQKMDDPLGKRAKKRSEEINQR